MDLNIVNDDYPEPCPFSDDEEDDVFMREFKDTDRPHKPCVLCSCVDTDVVANVKRMHQTNLGVISDASLYAMLSQYYHDEHVQRCRNAGIKADDIDATAMRRHFEYHEVDPLKRCVWNLRFVQTMTRDLRYQGVRERTVDGRVRFDERKAALATSLMSQERALLKELEQRRASLVPLGVTPPQFNEF